MPPYIRFVGTSRAPFRVGGQQITSKNVTVLDLGDPKTRQEVAHHVAIGRGLSLGFHTPSVGNVTVITSGGVVTPTKGTTVRGLDVSAGQLRVAGGTTQAIAATTVAFGAAHASLPRIDVVQVADATGVVTVQAGTAAANPTVPAPAASNTTLAAVYIPANATVASWINDLRPLPAV
jgi:hypothetical protein